MNSKKKITLNLDSFTIDWLSNYATAHLGSTSVSQAIRVLVKQLDEKHKTKEDN